MLTGAVLRIAQFLHNRSLTEGEAPLAMNIIERAFGGLTQPLDYNQAAPIGFLVVEKVFTMMLGTGEMALRLFPLIGSIAALFLFYRLAHKTVDATAAVFAIVLFAVCDHVIYFASEVKPYSTDVAVALVITILGYRLIKSGPSAKSWLLFSLVTAIGFWFSFPAVFVWSAFALIAIYRLTKKHGPWYGLTVCVIVPATSILIYYLVNLRFAAGQESLTDAWQSAFMPLPPRTWADLKWYPFVFMRMFKFPAGFSVYELSLAFLFFLVGILTYMRNRKDILLPLLLPIFAAMLASGLRAYPFEGRLLLFLAPALLMTISQGLSHIYTVLRLKSVISAFALLFVFFFLPVGNAAYRLIRPRAPEEFRPGLAHIVKNQQPGDIVYVYYASANAFKYYAYRMDYAPDHVIGIEARLNWSDYREDLSRLRGHERVWVIMSHIARTFGADEEKLYENYLNELGRQIEYRKFPGAAVFLYDLSVRSGQPILPF